MGSVRRGLLIAITALAAAHCNGKSGPTTAPPRALDDGGASAGESAACEALAGKVASLYRAEAGDQPMDEEIADNTAMILIDCRKHPAKFAPCIRAADSVAVLERDCIIPLDDRGEVEGRAFSATDPSK